MPTSAVYVENRVRSRAMPASKNSSKGGLKENGKKRKGTSNELYVISCQGEDRDGGTMSANRCRSQGRRRG